MQIAERRKLVSSIKNSIIDTEGNEQPYAENKVTTSSLDAAAKTQGNDTNQDHDLKIKYVVNSINFISGEYVVADSTEHGKKDLTINGTPFAASTLPQTKADISGDVQSKEVSSLPWKSSVGPTSASKVSTEEDSVKKLNYTTVRTATLPYKPFSREDEQQEYSKESSPENANVEAQDPTNEDVKPPPLAGPNVMNIIMVASECAPWSKTGISVMY